MRHFALLAVLFASSVALAQPARLHEVDPSQGAVLPPTSAATTDDATAIITNPAALTSVHALQLFYAHERSVAKDDIVDALYLSDTVFDLLGLGTSIEWVKSPSRPDFRKIGLGFAVGPEALSLGVTWNHFHSDESPDLGHLESFDLGLSVRPCRGFSFGVAVKNVDAPSYQTARLSRTYDVGVGIRPFGERFTVAVDWLQPNDDALKDGRLAYILQAELFQGVLLGAGVSHGFRDGVPLTFQLSATLNFSKFGVTYAVGGAPKGLTHTILARASVEHYKPVTLGTGKIALVDLADQLSSSTSPAASLLGKRAEDPWLRLTRFLDDANRDTTLKGIVMKFDSLPGFGLAKAQELRGQIIRLRAAGKKVVALLLTGGDAEYLAASAADQVFAVPEATLNIDGFAANVTFVGGTMNKLGVHWDVARVGAYKNAPDQLTKETMSAEQKETLDALLDSAVRNSQKDIAEARKQVTPEKLAQAQAGGLLLPARAKELGLVDDLVGPEELNEAVKKSMPGLRFSPEYAPGEERTGRWGNERRISIIPIVGTISGGKSRQDPLGVGETAGAETVVKALQDAMNDDQVSAIVLRVDSGGGDALASDLIYRAVLEAKKKKPVVASMGDVAASGGYYVAMAADEIFASPTTITGSIGVFLMKPSINELGEKIGLHTDTITRGPMTGLLSAWHSWSPEEQAAAQKWVDSFYDGFISRVAESRKLDKAKVDGIARGRVWAGDDAKSRGLVDTFGGLAEAISSAKKRAGLSEDAQVELDFPGDGGGLLSAVSGGASLGAPVQVDVAGVEAKALFSDLGVAPSEVLKPGLKAMMPFQLTIR